MTLQSIQTASPRSICPNLNFLHAGAPVTAVHAYIGINGTISREGSIVRGALEGPAGVSSNGYSFAGLSACNRDRIIVVAENLTGYSIKEIVQGLNCWTWMSGDSTANHTGIYGTKGVANAANMPGTRSAAASWIDSSGNLWLFGGQGRDSAGMMGRLNDLWKYEP